MSYRDEFAMARTSCLTFVRTRTGLSPPELSFQLNSGVFDDGTTGRSGPGRTTPIATSSVHPQSTAALLLRASHTQTHWRSDKSLHGRVEHVRIGSFRRPASFNRLFQTIRSIYGLARASVRGRRPTSTCGDIRRSTWLLHQPSCSGGMRSKPHCMRPDCRRWPEYCNFPHRPTTAFTTEGGWQMSEASCLTTIDAGRTGATQSHVFALPSNARGPEDAGTGRNASGRRSVT